MDRNAMTLVFFAVIPYLVLFIFLLGTIFRYRDQSFTYSSLSTQVLENKKHFWAVVPFHYGILAVLGAHFLAFLIPRGILLWNSHPLRLYLLEATGLGIALMTLVGLVGILMRRFNENRVRVVTSAMDWVVYALLLLQVASGIYLALFRPWGSSWFAAVLSPYLWSLLRFNPRVGLVSGLPLEAQFHIVNAFLIIGLFPFTRLVHALVVPNPYLWRKPQVVRWYGIRRKA